VRHPRTAVGVCPDGKFIILVVDGRIPAHSNGATLYDLALFFKKLGATEALNLDGGGSSTFLVRKGEEFELLNTPADLVRPDDKLIRPIFNSVLIVKK
jgi:exopolysaccharide biosynthesis protein